MKEYEVKVVIPVYRADLSDMDMLSLDNTVHKLHAYPIVLLAPEGLDLQRLHKRYPQLECVRVSDEWIGSRNGIEGYNRMMLSREFYALFDACEYILICQLDAWIFRDELHAWCMRGYDYIAAPWPKRPIYNFAPIKAYLRVRRYYGQHTSHFLRQDMFDKIGNGGLSLRRIDSFKRACNTYREEIRFFNDQSHHFYNEDVFWAIIPEDFTYPTVREAVAFSFDVNPNYCYHINGNRLPFGCHGLNYSRTLKFWQRVTVERDAFAAHK